MMSFSGSLSVLSSLSTSSSPLSSTSSAALFLLSTLFMGHVTGTPKGYDYDIYDDGAYDPFNGPNIVKVNKVVDYYSKPQYAFGYEVDDPYNLLSHGRWEIRDGDVTQGQYRVLLPDGRIQIVSYIADKFGYRPTVEYIGKGAHPPPPPAYANVKPVVAPIPLLASPAPPLPVVFPTALPVLTATAFPRIKTPLGYGDIGGGHQYHHLVDPYDPVKIKLNSFPVNGPFPVVDPYALGYGYGLDPAFAASSNNPNKVSRKRALLYDRTLFRKDVEKRSPNSKNVRRVKIKRQIRGTTTTTTTSTTMRSTNV